MIAVRAGAGNGQVLTVGELVRRPERWSRLLSATTVAGLLIGLVGPYNSFTANPASRLLYWVMLFWAGTVILWPSAVLGLLAALRRGFPPAFGATAALLVASIPLAAVAAAGCYLFWPVHASGIRAVEWYVQTLIIALPAAGIALWLETGGKLRRHALSPTAAPVDAPLDDGLATSTPLLPSHLIEAALCLQMEDHHIRVHTIGRSHLHLASLRHVVAQLGPDMGMQVHRSWWVARRAVASWEEKGRSVTLVLTNDLRVPVARNRVAQLRSLGWLAG